MTATTNIKVKDFIAQITEQMNEHLRKRPLYDSRDVYDLINGPLNTLLKPYDINAYKHQFLVGINDITLDIFSFNMKYASKEKDTENKERQRVLSINIFPTITLSENKTVQDLIDERYIRMIQTKIEALDSINTHLENRIKENNNEKSNHQEKIFSIKAPKITLEDFIDELEQLTNGVKKEQGKRLVKQIDYLITPFLHTYGLYTSAKHVYMVVNGDKQMILQYVEKRNQARHSEDIYDIHFEKVLPIDVNMTLHEYCGKVRKHFIQNRIEELKKFARYDDNFGGKLEQEKKRLEEELNAMK
ncbi:hypothetical protein CN918_28905 [Priestia megaterium]|nr:hypothetical protein CN918_28905 [Priestia megaterium]